MLTKEELDRVNELMDRKEYVLALYGDLCGDKVGLGIVGRYNSGSSVVGEYEFFHSKLAEIESDLVENLIIQLESELFVIDRELSKYIGD